MKGVAAAEGYHRGRACVLNDPIERGKLQRGDILVAKRADAEWNDIIHEVEAVVLEVGGRISHGPMICRRLGIPCVSGSPPSLSISTYYFVDICI